MLNILRIAGIIMIIASIILFIYSKSNEKVKVKPLIIVFVVGLLLFAGTTIWSAQDGNNNGENSAGVDSSNGNGDADKENGEADKDNGEVDKDNGEVDKENGETDDKDDEVADKEIDTTEYPSGTYEIGEDLASGEYVFIADWFDGYVAVASDATEEVESIITDDNFITNVIVTVTDGQFLKVEGADFYQLGAEPELDLADEGHFKVGTHVPAGEYKVIDHGSGYIEVSSDSTHDLDSVISNQMLEGDTTITLKDGQYVKFNRASLEE